MHSRSSDLYSRNLQMLHIFSWAPLALSGQVSCPLIRSRGLCRIPQPTIPDNTAGPWGRLLTLFLVLLFQTSSWWIIQTHRRPQIPLVSRTVWDRYGSWHSQPGEATRTCNNHSSIQILAKIMVGRCPPAEPRTHDAVSSSGLICISCARFLIYDSPWDNISVIADRGSTCR